MTVDATRQEARAIDVRDGARVRLAVRGTKSTVTVTGVPILTTEEGLTIALPNNQLVTVQNEPLPETAESVVRGSVNGGPEETLVLTPNNAGNLRWRRVVAGAFVGPADTIDNVRVYFQAASPVVPASKATVPPGSQP